MNTKYLSKAHVSALLQTVNISLGASPKSTVNLVNFFDSQDKNGTISEDNLKDWIYKRHLPSRYNISALQAMLSKRFFYDFYAVCEYSLAFIVQIGLINDVELPDALKDEATLDVSNHLSIYHDHQRTATWILNKTRDSSTFCMSLVLKTPKSTGTPANYLPRKIWGRSSEMEFISTSSKQTTCIYGGPGVGKSSMLRELYAIYRNQYDIVIWLDADNSDIESGIIQDLNQYETYRKKALAKAIEDICPALQEEIPSIDDGEFEIKATKLFNTIYNSQTNNIGGARPSIIFFIDNLPATRRFATSLKKWLPLLGKCKHFITSRQDLNLIFPELDCDSFEIGTMHNDLLSCRGILKQNIPKSIINKTDRDVFDKIILLANHLPIALSAINRFLMSKIMAPEELLLRMERSSEDGIFNKLHDFDSTILTINKSAYRSYTNVMKSISETLNKKELATCQLISLLGPSWIPNWLLENHENLHIDTSFTAIKTKHLVETGTDNVYGRMHRLNAEFFRATIWQSSDKELDNIVYAALHLLRTSLPDLLDKYHETKNLSLADQIKSSFYFLSNLAMGKIGILSHKCIFELIHLNLRIGLYQLVIGARIDALKVCGSVLPLCTKYMSANSHDRITKYISINVVLICHMFVGNYQKASAIGNQAIQQVTHEISLLLGKPNGSAESELSLYFDILNYLRYNLANTLFQQNRLNESKELLEICQESRHKHGIKFSSAKMNIEKLMIKIDFLQTQNFENLLQRIKNLIHESSVDSMRGPDHFKTLELIDLKLEILLKQALCKNSSKNTLNNDLLNLASKLKLNKEVYLRSKPIPFPQLIRNEVVLLKLLFAMKSSNIPFKNLISEHLIMRTLNVIEREVGLWSSDLSEYATLLSKIGIKHSLPNNLRRQQIDSNVSV